MEAWTKIFIQQLAKAIISTKTDLAARDMDVIERQLLSS